MGLKSTRCNISWDTRAALQLVHCRQAFISMYAGIAIGCIHQVQPFEPSGYCHCSTHGDRSGLFTCKAGPTHGHSNLARPDCFGQAAIALLLIMTPCTLQMVHIINVTAIFDVWACERQSQWVMEMSLDAPSKMRVRLPHSRFQM